MYANFIKMLQKIKRVLVYPIHERMCLKFMVDNLILKRKYPAAIQRTQYGVEHNLSLKFDNSTLAGNLELDLASHKHLAANTIYLVTNSGYGGEVFAPGK